MEISDLAGEQPPSPHYEIAHVICLDIVGYSTRKIGEQTASVNELSRIVRGTTEFQRAMACREVLPLPTGDGMILVYFRDPISPARTAVEIASVLSGHPSISVRIGVHSGPVQRIFDIGGKENVAGPGVNLAQRVMDCGDVGHILLSATYAEMLGEFEEWAGKVTDLGHLTVKHGVTIGIANLITDKVGNPALPSKLAAAVSAIVPNRSGRKSVVVIYKRNQEPDVSVLAMLERKLGERDCDVFIDRHLTIGIAWANEIERRIRSADFVIPLVSEASATSEMMEYELQSAWDEYNRRGKPTLLPVRVGFDGQLPQHLAAILDPLMYFLWGGSNDDSDLVRQLVGAIHDSPKEKSALVTKIEPVGGAVPLDSSFYISRPTDAEFLAAIGRRDSIVLVKGGRQMGKTSLLARGIRHARENDTHVVLTDLQKLNRDSLETPDSLYRTLAEMIADQLDLSDDWESDWADRRGPNNNFERFLRRSVLKQLDGNLVWALDEVDRLLTCPFGSEVFGLFRSWHNARSLDPDGPWGRLTLAIAYATEPHLFITDLNQSPFNVGTRLSLADFTLDQVRELNALYKNPIRSDQLHAYYELLAGHPYLTRKGMEVLAGGEMGFDEFLEVASTDEGPYGDHLRRLLVSLSQEEHLLQTITSFLRGDPIDSSDVFYRLRTAGVVCGASIQTAKCRCELYVRYLRSHLSSPSSSR